MSPTPVKNKSKKASKKPSKTPNMQTPNMIDVVTTALEDAKAEDIVSIDIRGKSAIADFMVIASGRSHRHVGAVADQLSKALHKSGFEKARTEGMPHCDWVLVDGGDVIVHIFRPEVREFYNIEKMWSGDFDDSDV
jgi:ribosome-associated protein